MASENHLHRPVTLATMLDLCEHKYELAVWCGWCRRWGDLDLARLVAEGHGSRPVLSVRARCRECGERRGLRLRPPVPERPGGVMFLEHREN